MTAEHMQSILDQTLASAEIEGSTLKFTKLDGSSFTAGDFYAYINSQITPAVNTAMTPINAALDSIPGQVSTAVNSAVPTAVAGGVTAKGNQSGAVSFSGLTPAQMVNRLITMTLTGNISIDSAAFPTPAIAGTQFAIVMKQDATGGRTLTLTGIKKSQGVLVLSTGSNATDIIMFMYDGTSWYAGAMGVGFV
jgi:hypothetical protein